MRTSHLTLAAVLTGACLLGPLTRPMGGQQSNSSVEYVRQISGWNQELNRLAPGSGASNPARVKAILLERAVALGELLALNPQEAIGLMLPQETLDRLHDLAPQQTLESRAEWEGLPEEIVADDFEHHRSRTFWQMKTPEGRQFELFFAGRPPEHGMAIRVKAVQIGARLAVEEFVYLQGSTVQQCTTIGPQNIAVLMLTMPSNPTFPSAFTQAGLNEAFFGSSTDTSNLQSLNGYWNETSYGQTSAAGQVFGPFALSQDYTCDQQNNIAAAAINAADGTVDFTKYTRIAMFFPISSCDYGGWSSIGCWSVSSPSKGTLSESESFFPAFPNSVPSIPIYDHELGHGLGLNHANTEDYGNIPLGPLNSPGTVLEYGDPFSVMGSSACSSGGQYGAKHKSTILHWLSPNSGYQEVQSSGTYTVSPFEASGLRALHILRDSTSDAWLWLEYRQPIGDFDSTLECFNSNVFNGALIHYEDPTLDSLHTYLLDFNPVSTPNSFNSSALSPGQSWSDPYSLLTLRVNSANTSGLSVTVQYDQPCASLQISSSTFPATGGSGTVTVTAPANCAWTASTPASWITFTSSTSGNGNGVVTFLVAANSASQQQTAYLTVQRQSLQVIQTGASGLTVIGATPNSGSGSSTTFIFQFGDTRGYNDVTFAQAIFSDAASCTISVYPGGKYVYLNNDAGGWYGPLYLGQSGTLSNGECTVYSAGSSITGSANQLTVTIKIGFQASWPGTHAITARAMNSTSDTGTINVGMWTVPGGSACVSFSPSLQSFPTAGGAGSISVVGSCAWLAASSESWISITSGASGTGNGTVSFSVAANPSDGPRTGTILIGGQAFVVTQPAAFLITTLAGGLPPSTPLPGVAATLASPQGVVSDSAGNLYIAATQLDSVFKLDLTGTLTRVAGTGVPGYSGDGGAATSAALNQPAGIALDNSGNLYIADTNNFRIRKVSSAGIITTVAGTGNCCFSGDGATAVSANLYYPSGLAVSPAGALYISDTWNHRVRMVNTSGIISTIAGNGTQGYSGDGGTATSAMLNVPTGVAVDASGNVYICDRYNQRVRKISAGLITTIAGIGTAGFSGDGALATSAMLNYPMGLTVDASANLYIADTSNNRIRKLATNGVISTVAGNGNYGYSGDGAVATSASLEGPQGVATDVSGDLYIADTSNGRVRKVSVSGIITTSAGGGNGGDGGAGVLAQFSLPQSVTSDNAGNIYIADTSGNRVREILAGGTVTPVAGNGIPGNSGDGLAATSAELNSPWSVAVDASSNLYISDTNNCRIRKVSTSGTITAFAGNGCYFGGDGGQASGAGLLFRTESHSTDRAIC